MCYNKKTYNYKLILLKLYSEKSLADLKYDAEQIVKDPAVSYRLSSL